MSKFMWHPETGERVLFADDETAPANYLPTHPKDPDLKRKIGTADMSFSATPEAEQAPQEDPAGGMTKAEIADALKAGGVEFDVQNNKAALTEQLRGALKTVLTDRGVAYDENETAKALLAKATVAPQE